jgi:Cobalamin-independent synthase, Catalytic domain
MSSVLDLPAGTATGVGSWPGTEVAEALRIVRGELGALPHQPELPARGPGADLIGRAASRLAGLSVDLQPSGWRLVDHPGRDQARAQAFWREDLDRLATVFDGWQGPFKVQLAGPWTLAASVQLARGERAVADPGARRDLAQSLAESVAELVTDLRRLVPGCRPVLQLDEPSVPAVLAGRLPTASGYGTLRSVPVAEVREGLGLALRAAERGGALTVVHCCAAQPPIELLSQVGADAVSLDVGLLGRSGWESVAAMVEGGTRLWAGAVPTVPSTMSEGAPSADSASAEQVADGVFRAWRGVGLAASSLAEVVLTPACGLAVADGHQQARDVLRVAVRAARGLADRAQG